MIPNEMIGCSESNYANVKRQSKNLFAKMYQTPIYFEEIEYGMPFTKLILCTLTRIYCISNGNYSSQTEY